MAFTMRTFEKLGSNVTLTIIYAILCALTLSRVSGHVTLTYPPARGLPIDFLNNFWTKAPCGMPKGNLIFFRKLAVFCRQIAIKILQK